MAQQQKYIVVFKQCATQEQIEHYVREVERHGGMVTNKYEDVIKGFAGGIPEKLLHSFQDDNIIDYIEPDGILTTQ